MRSGFQPGIEVTDPDLLFGHNRPGQLLDQLARHLQMGTNVQVLGERRAGKTSVLRCCQALLRRTQPHLVPVYLNYRNYPSIRGQEQAYSLLLAQVHAEVVASRLPDAPGEITVRGVRFAATPSMEAHLEALAGLPSYKFEGVLTDYFRVLNEQGLGIVLLIDEYEHLLRNTLAGQVGAFFLIRQVTSQPAVRPGSPKPVTYAVAGVKSWEELCSLIGSPELNNITARLYVDPLDESAFTAMWSYCLAGSSVEAQAQVAQAGLSVERVYTLVGGWPFYGKVLGNHLCAGLYTEQMAYEALCPHFNVIWSHLTEEERSRLVQSLDGWYGERDGTLNDLISRGLLAGGDAVRVRGQLWRRYVAERAAEARPAAHRQKLPVGPAGQLQLLTEEITTLITDINEFSRIVAGKDIFLCSNQDVQIYRDLRQPAHSRERFTHFALSAYNLLFERTIDARTGSGQKPKPLERLPAQFRRAHRVVRVVDVVRHYFGKAHITQVDTFRPHMRLEEVLERYLGRKVLPEDDDFLILQLGMLNDIKNYLEELYDYLRRSAVATEGSAPDAATNT